MSMLTIISMLEVMVTIMSTDRKIEFTVKVPRREFLVAVESDVMPSVGDEFRFALGAEDDDKTLYYVKSVRHLITSGHAESNLKRCFIHHIALSEDKP